VVVVVENIKYRTQFSEHIPDGSINWTKCCFSTTDRDFFYQISGFTGERLSTVLEILLKYVHCFKNYSFYDI